MSVCIYKVYIDEAGDIGFKFRENKEVDFGESSEWLVISAVICPSESDRLLETICEKGIKLLSSKKTKNNARSKFAKGLHFADIKEHDQRLAWAKIIGSHRLDTCVVALNKKYISAQDRDWFHSEKGKCSSKIYLYALRILLRDVCCLVKHLSPKNKPVLSLIFDKRGGINYSNLKNEIHKIDERPSTDITLNPKNQKGERFPGVFKISILPIPNWEMIIDENIISASNSDYPGLQVVDCISSGVHKMLGSNELGVSDCSYATALLSETLFTFSTGSHRDITMEIKSLLKAQRESGLAIKTLFKS